MTTLVKQHRLVMKVAEIRASVHLLQPIEADGKTFVSQISIENEEGGFAQRGAGQGNALGGSVLGVLSLDSLDRLEPQLPPRLDEHGFILRLNTFLPGVITQGVGRRGWREAERSVRAPPLRGTLWLILCRHGTRRSRTLEQGRTDRAGAPAAAPAEDLAHLLQAALHGPQATPRAGPPRRAKPGHEGHSRTLAQDPDRVIEHRPTCCPDCGLVLPPDLPAETVSTHEHIELPPVRPVVEQHRRLAVTCPACQARVAAPRPAGAASTPFGARLHATAVYLKCFQALSYERLQRALSDLFGLTISQGGLMAMLRRAQARFAPGREAALSALRRAAVVACDETGVRIEGSNSYHWVFRCDDAVVHHAAPTRAGSVVREIMGGHRPAVWLSDRYSAQQGHADRQQTCLAHLARDVAYALEAGDDPVAFRLKLWLGSAFALARGIGSLAASTINAKRRKLEAALDEILAAPVTCDLARDIQTRMRRARDQVLTFASFPGRVEATNNACERDLRPAVIQRKNTNGYRAMWSAQGEAAVRTVVATARLKAGPSTFGTVLSTITARPLPIASFYPPG